MKLHRIRILFLLSVTFFAPHALADRIQKPELSFDLPAQWKEIPSDVLAEVQKGVTGEIANTSSKIHLLEWKYAFQSPSSQHWMDYPYILVQVSSSGRIPESKLEALPKIDITDTKNEVSAALKNLADNISMGEVQYDAEKRIIWSTLAMDVKEIGGVKALTALLPTETGYIQINGYSRDNMFSVELPLFKTIVESVTLPPELAYRQRIADRVPFLQAIDFEKVLTQGFAAGLIMFLIVMGKRLRDKIKKRDTDKSSDSVVS